MSFKDSLASLFDPAPAPGGGQGPWRSLHRRAPRPLLPCAPSLASRRPTQRARPAEIDPDADGLDDPRSAAAEPLELHADVKPSRCGAPASARS
jgi:hypothetical protein